MSTAIGHAMGDGRVEKQAHEASGDALWRALQRLRATGCWLMFGAHPDDEWSAFLAYLALGLGMRTVYACATRGEGGQNAVGPERGADLGVLRSREMERAAAEIGLEILWLSAGEADTITDFGFARSAEDTLARWGATRLIDRMAEAIRAVRPDIVCPTFLDVPGQHGHHRAVTRSLSAAVAHAADPAWSGEGRAAWQVELIYLPAFPGSGGTYDDRKPPPPATVTVDLGAVAPVLGASWAQIGEWSRRHHASQGMGRWLAPGSHPWPLHRLDGMTEEVLAADASAGGMAALAPDAAAATAEALAAWPNRAAVSTALGRMMAALAVARAGPRIAGSQADRLLARKQREAGAAAALALRATVSVTPQILRAGATAELAVTPAPLDGVTVTPRVPSGWRVTGGPHRFDVHVPIDATPFGTLRPGWDPLGGDAPVGVDLRWHCGNAKIAANLDPAQATALAPADEVTVTPSVLLRRTDDQRPAELQLVGTEPPLAWPVRSKTASPEGWQVTLTLPTERTILPPAGRALHWIGSPDEGGARLIPATATLLRLEAQTDRAARIGVIAGQADSTLGSLDALGIEAEALDDASITAGDLRQFTTLVIGMLGFGQRPAVAAVGGRINAWMEAGGSLVTLCHRPSDGWDPMRTPPHRLVIGTPSFRWRVTEPDAPVRVLASEHRLLTWPNRIGEADWQGWVRERALYAASEWDPAYVPLLEMADAGEPLLHGTLLAAPVGRGRHVHVALALHHQWQALVSGAFRLLANLVAAP